jgi:DNA-directed RNA polymerase specialized sigma24 family protein
MTTLDGHGGGESVTVGDAALQFNLAFDGLYRQSYRVAYRVLGDRGDAEDVAQEALARALVRWGSLHGKPKLG